MTTGDIESIYINQLKPLYDKEESRALAALAASYVCNLSKPFFALHKREELTLEQERSMIRILDDLRSGMPLQYIVGEASFYGLKFRVNSSVLIPRPETEELVNWILHDMKNVAEHLSILDIGTGSGCIPITLKAKIPEAIVNAIDISEEALIVASHNAVQNHTDVKFIHADILDESFFMADTRYHVIVSNPPYVTEAEKAAMHENVLKYEPHTALFVPDTDPLLFYNKIAAFALTHLAPNGSLFLGINEAFGQETLAMLNSNGYKSELRKDMSGKDRMIKAELIK